MYLDAISIVISFFAGAAVTAFAMHAFGKRLLRVAKMVNDAQNALRDLAKREVDAPPVSSASPASSAVKRFDIHLELDADRVLDVGIASAMQEEAQRIGRLN